jgi:hypothetical protein
MIRLGSSFRDLWRNDMIPDHPHGFRTESIENRTESWENVDVMRLWSMAAKRQISAEK